MSLTPDWAPNIHPIVVHFPIALLSAAVAVDLLGLFMRKSAPIRDTATWLYCAGAGVAILAYFTGSNGADAMLLPAQVNPLVTEHSDWAFRTTWFFAFFASARLAVSYILPPKPIVLAGAFVVAVGGFFMLVQTAEHGAMLVFQHGLGVQAITTDEPLAELAGAADPDQIDPGIIDLANGSWVWRPTQDADTVLADQFTWLENSDSHVAPAMVQDADRGSVLGLHPHGMPVLFIAGGHVGVMQADVQVNIDAFDGTLQLVYHVQDARTFDFLSVEHDAVKLGRTDGGVTTVFEEKPLKDTGWLALRVFGGNGHFRGYVNGELMTHGHADDLAAGPFGLRIDGTGTVLIERILVQAIS
ncbi:MAG: DUF2231 domain-containing protein [Vicinamibacterales bacterium]